MQLKLLRQYFADYERELRAGRRSQRLYIWEAQRIFQEHWDLEAADLAAMYDRSLESPVTRRLWKRESYEPKRMMLEFIRMAPDFTRQMFRDLFDDDRSLEGRAGRFVFYCDELLQQYKASHPTSIENNHYHDDDYRMVFLYLAFRFPERYTLYDPQVFVKTLGNLGVANLPLTNDPERYAKVVRTIAQLMHKETAIAQLHRQMQPDERYFQGESLLLVYDFCAFVSGEVGVV